MPETEICDVIEMCDVCGKRRPSDQMQTVMPGPRRVCGSCIGRLTRRREMARRWSPGRMRGCAICGRLTGLKYTVLGEDSKKGGRKYPLCRGCFGKPTEEIERRLRAK